MIEDSHFYDECDRLGLMLLQEFPHAGCAPGGPGDSMPDTATRLPLDKAQTVMGLKQLVNHPSIVRYNCKCSDFLGLCLLSSCFLLAAV